MFFNRNKKFLNGGCEYIIAGLGNPGAKYEMTRHNAGFLAVTMLANDLGVDIKRLKFHSLVAECTVGGKKCLLMKPQTMMNNSGEAIAEAANFYKIPSENVLIIYDDISLEIGNLRIRRKGSAGGHNGIKSIISHLKSEEFPRIKIGVGKKPNPEYDLAAWVLSRFPKESEPALKKSLENACSAAKLIAEGNAEKAMNAYNS